MYFCHWLLSWSTGPTVVLWHTSGITARRQAELDKAVSLIGRSVAAVQCDVCNLADLDRLYAKVASKQGKIWQFDPDDRTPVRLDTSALCFAPAPDVPGVEFAVLHESAWELVLLERWAPGASLAVPIPEGIELLVLDGSFINCCWGIRRSRARPLSRHRSR